MKTTKLTLLRQLLFIALYTVALGAVGCGSAEPKKTVPAAEPAGNTVAADSPDSTGDAPESNVPGSDDSNTPPSSPDAPDSTPDNSTPDNSTPDNSTPGDNNGTDTDGNSNDNTDNTDDNVGDVEVPDANDDNNSNTPDADDGLDLDSCSKVGFEAIEEVADTDGDNFTYRAAKGPVDAYDLMEVASFQQWNGPTAPGTYPLDGVNYKDCGLCLLLWEACNEDACEKIYYANEGVVEITSIGPEGTLFAGSLSGVIFKEVEIEDDYTSTEVEGGENWCIADYSFSQEFGADVTINEPAVDVDDTTTTTPGTDNPADTTGDDTTVDDTTDDSCTLTMRAEVRDESGPCTDCAFGDYITVYGVIENPCNERLTYQSDRSCLVSEFIILNTVEGSSAEYVSTCTTDVRTEELSRDESATQSRPAGRLSAGSYELSVQFEDEDQTVRTVAFTVN